VNLKSFKFRILKENSLQPVRSWFCLLFILGLFLPACILPAGASVIPGDSSGDTCVSDEELASSILSYMEYSHLGKEGPHLSAEELSLAAHNFRNIPYGRVVIPVLSEGDFITPNIWYKMGVPTGSLIYEGLVTRNRTATTIPGLQKAGTPQKTQRSGLSGSKKQNGRTGNR